MIISIIMFLLLFLLFNIELSIIFEGFSKVCFNKKTNHHNLYLAIDKLQNRLDELELDVKGIKKKMGKILSNYDKHEKESREAEKIRNNSAQKAKEAFSQNMTKNASILSGFTPEKSKKMLDQHLSQTLTEKNFKKFIKSLKPPNMKEVRAKNEKNANLYQKITSGKIDNSSSKITGSYMSKNLVKCKCPEHMLSEELINSADHYGFGTLQEDIMENCDDEDNDCKNNLEKKSRRKAKDNLKFLSQLHGCKIDNIDGMFPTDANNINQSPDIPTGVKI